MRRLAQFGMSVMVLLLTSGVTVAAELGKPTMIEPLPARRYYGAYALGLLLVVVVCIGAFKSGRRSHLD